MTVRRPAAPSEMADSGPNQTLLIIGYGSLLSGYGLLGERRGGRSRLIAREAFPVTLSNARRGLAKPSSHGRYLAMDLEPIQTGAPISAHLGVDGAPGLIGALGLVFDREWAEQIARREDYAPGKFLELIALADRAKMPLGRFLYEIAERADFELAGYQRTLLALLGYVSDGYNFYPLTLDDGRFAVAAVGASVIDGAGKTSSKRGLWGITRLLTLGEVLATDGIELDHRDQVGYFVECVLGGLHGLAVSDLMEGFDREAQWGADAAQRFAAAAAGERDRFLKAASLEESRYLELFGANADSNLAALLEPLAPEWQKL
jgi:hypothetical protein